MHLSAVKSSLKQASDSQVGELSQSGSRRGTVEGVSASERLIFLDHSLSGMVQVYTLILVVCDV